MSGTKMGSIKKKLGLRGKTKPGEMISAMNKSKVKALGGSFNGAGRLGQSKVAKTIKKII